MRFTARTLFIALMALLVCCVSAGAAAEEIPSVDILTSLLTGGDEPGILPPVNVTGPEEEVPDGGGLTSMPLQFIRNEGQYDPDVEYTIMTDGGSVYFTREGVIFQLVSISEEQVDTAWCTTSSRCPGSG